MNKQTRQFILSVECHNPDIMTSIEGLYSFCDTAMYAFRATYLTPPHVFHYPTNNTDYDRLIDTLSASRLEQSADFISDLQDQRRDHQGGIIAAAIANEGFLLVRTNTDEETVDISASISTTADLSAAAAQNNAFYSAIKQHMDPTKMTGVLIHKPSKALNQLMSISRISYRATGQLEITQL